MAQVVTSGGLCCRVSGDRLVKLSMLCRSIVDLGVTQEIISKK